jgi:hypothetical protein
VRRNVGLTLLLSFALFVKALIPSGWMPSGEEAFEIIVCAGTETHSVWLDKNGELHEQDPGDAKGDGARKGSCPFAAIAQAADLPSPAIMADPVGPSSYVTYAPLPAIAIGKGLAAPPPPQTGPPLRT